MGTITTADARLRKEMLHATKWAAAGQFLNQGLSAGTTLLLAGLLGPAAFGTVSLGYLAITFLQLIVGFGFNSALIQHRDTEEIHLSSVFWLNLAMAVGLMPFAIVGSLFFAATGGATQIRNIVIALSVLLPIQAFSVVQIAVLNKKMDFRILSLRSGVAVALSGIVGLSLAFLGFGVWALVAQHVMREIVSGFLLWTHSEWRPRFTFSWDAIGDLSGFATKSMIGNVGTFFQNQFDSIVVGVVLGPLSLGLYRLADRLVELNLSIFPRAIQTVSLSHFSKLQGDKAAFNQNFLFGAKLNSFLTLPSLAYLAGSGPLILGFFGDAWIGAADVMSILVMVGGTKAVVLFAGPTLQAMARPGIVSVATWIGAIANVAVIVLVASLQASATDDSRLLGIAIARALVFCGILTPLLLVQVRSTTGLSLSLLWKSVRPACVTALVVFLSQRSLAYVGLWGLFRHSTLSVGVSLAVALFTVTACVRRFDSQLWQNLVGPIADLWHKRAPVHQDGI